jgi:phospholipase/carboxylesterase
MNRIELRPETVPAPFRLPTDCADLDRHDTRVTAGSHALFAPLHYEANYAYPLIVWLHEPGDSEDQLKRIMPAISMRNYVAVAPRGTVASNEDTGEGGYSWPQTDGNIFLAEQRVMECVEVAMQRFHIAPARVLLAGLAEGGTMALRVALNNPCRFAGVASIGGAFPRGKCPLRQLDDARRLPLLLATGRNSQRYRQAEVAVDLRLLHSAGISVTLRQYPCGDDLTADVLPDLDRWFMQQVAPPGLICTDD